MEEFIVEAPRSRVSINFETANSIFIKHLHETITSITEIDIGFNSRIYSVQANTGNQHILKLCGFISEKLKTENEVACLRLLKSKTTIPVPTVFHFNSSSDEIGAEYIIMEKIRGTSLSTLWDNMSLNDKKNIIEQLVDIIVKMKSLTFPKIGCFAFQGNEIIIGACIEHIEGPFGNYVEFISQQFERQVAKLESWQHLQSMHDLIPKLKIFIKEVVSQYDGLEGMQFVMTHGDLDVQNIIVENNIITGIIDFEFSGSYPEAEEWVTSFFTQNELEDDKVALTEISILSKLFYSGLEKNNVATPRTIPKYNKYRALYTAKEDIAPWYLRELKVTQQEDAKSRIEHVRANIENVLNTLFFIFFIFFLVCLVYDHLNLFKVMAFSNNSNH